MFLRFAWGRSRLPPAEKFDQKLKIARLATSKPDSSLPQSHTCFFDLEVPEYSSYEILRSKLLYAITFCVAMDSDFNVRNAGDWA
jgi:hypothetical protein